MMLSSHVTAPGEARVGLNPYQDDDVDFSCSSSVICGAGTAYLDFGGVCVPHLSFSVFIHPVIYVVGTKQ
jgi:hypothetical protein